jgi:hypothetical protein
MNVFHDNMSYQQKSGSTKRKEKQRGEDETKRGRKTPFQFGWTSKPSNAADSTESRERIRVGERQMEGNSEKGGLRGFAFRGSSDLIDDPNNGNSWV